MVKEISDSTFKAEVLDFKDTAVLVDFWAPWCGPCRMLAPIVEQMSVKFNGKLKVLKLNTDENQNTSMDYQITGIPCLIAFKDGKEINRFIGLRPAEALEADLKKITG